jgi:hypothetical protein
MNTPMVTGQVGTYNAGQPLPSIAQSPAMKPPRKRKKKMGEVPAAVAAFKRQMKVK